MHAKVNLLNSFKKGYSYANFIINIFIFIYVIRCTHWKSLSKSYLIGNKLFTLVKEGIQKMIDDDFELSEMLDRVFDYP